MSNQIFDKKDREIIREVYPWKNTGLSCYDIAKKTGISWVTVKKRLKTLINKKIFIKETSGNLKFNYPLVEESELK